MEHFKTEIVPAQPAKEVQKYDKTTCDLCNEQIKEHNFDYDEVSISRKIGSRYPDSGTCNEVKVDMCGKCFETKLVPWLKSMDVTLTEKETFW